MIFHSRTQFHRLLGPHVDACLQEGLHQLFACIANHRHAHPDNLGHRVHAQAAHDACLIPDAIPRQHFCHSLGSDLALLQRLAVCCKLPSPLIA